MEKSINFDRLRADIEALSAVGRDEQSGGLFRPAFSDGDMQGRAWLKQRIEEAGLDCYEDAAGNIFARLQWDEGQTPSVMAGSHIDTVPDGGPLDGALGVLCGLEALRSAKERGAALSRPLECAAFTDEEGRFGPMLGSRAMIGTLTEDHIKTAADPDGHRLAAVMKDRGYDPAATGQARRDPGSIHAYVELHIEQGPVLYEGGISVGVVEGIAGLFKWQVQLDGVPNHAGTTPMNMRKDALQGLAAVAAAIPAVIAESGSENSVATIGKVDVRPGAPNVVPGRAVFTMDVRDIDPDILNGLETAFEHKIKAISDDFGLGFSYERLSKIEPVSCDSGLVKTAEKCAETLGIDYKRMPSGAAHDAQNVAALAPVVMLFVPSIDGISHNPAEWTDWPDIENGANVLYRTLLDIAG